MKFSWKIAIGKGIKYLVVFAIAVIPFLSQLVPPEISQMTISELLVYLFPVLKSLTVGGFIVILLNWLKVKKGVSILS